MIKPISKLTAVLAMTSLSLSLSGCGIGEAKDAGAAPLANASSLPVEVTIPGIGDIYATYETTSPIASDAEAPVVTKVDGEVIEILVEEGDLVKAGQLLARLDGERSRLEMLKAKAELEKTSKEHQRNLRLKEKNLVSASAIEGLEYDLISLQARYELKKLYYSYTEIRAPLSGVVSSRDIKLGQHLDVSTATFKVTDTTRLVAYLKIPQSELAKFSVGHRSTIRVDAMPDETFTATIARISPTIDTKNGTFRATAYIENKDNALAPGMFGRFSIAYEKHANALTIPTASVVFEDNATIVYVIEDGAAVRRSVVTGIESGGHIEITDGLKKDDQVVITGQGSLRDGSKVLASATGHGIVTG